MRFAALALVLEAMAAGAAFAIARGGGVELGPARTAGAERGHREGTRDGSRDGYRAGKQVGIEDGFARGRRAAYRRVLVSGP